jgi:hypothetical protein
VAARCQTSIGTSSPTGRGRPERAWRNASAASAGTSPGARISEDHFVTVRRISDWPTISCSAPVLRPIWCSGTWPTTASTGALAEWAVASAEAALRKPGPGTTHIACGRPVAIAAPSAM